MGKKNKKKKDSFNFEFGGYCKKKSKDDDKKKSKKNRDSGSFKIKSTLDKGDIRENHKLARKPYKLPEKLRENRAVCNHAVNHLTLDAFDASGMNPQVVPVLKQMVKTFGETNVKVCNACMDVVVNPEVVTVEKIEAAICVLYAANNVVAEYSRLSKKERESLFEMREGLLKDQMEVLAMFKDMVEDHRGKVSNRESDDREEEIDPSRLNGASFVS